MSRICIGFAALLLGAQPTFVWPTSIDLQRDGALLLVENGHGRVVRLQPATGKVTLLASGLAKPFAAVRAPSGVVYVSNGHALQRLDGTEVAHANEDIGPVAIAPGGAVFYATATRVFRLGAPRPIARGLAGPHGLAVARDGAVLICDTGHGRVIRVDPAGGVSTLVRIGEPRGIDVAADGTVYVVEAVAKRIGRFSATGASLGVVGPTFVDPYDVEVAPKGVLYVVETAAAGHIERVVP